MSDASATIRNLLARYGLESLSEWAWGQLTSGASPAEVDLQMREQPAYRTRFRAIFEREQRGLPPISPDDVLAYEQQRRSVLRAYGYPEGFYDSPDDAVEGLVGDVSISELERRAQLWVDYSQSQYAPETLRELQQRYGVSGGSLAAFSMDQERALPLIEQQVKAAEVAARARRFGWNLSLGEAERLGGAVGEAAEATDRFDALDTLAPVLGDRLGDQLGGMGRDDMLEVAAGDPTALRRAQRRVDRSTSQFRTDSGVAATNRGIGGLGGAD